MLALETTLTSACRVWVVISGLPVLSNLKVVTSMVDLRVVGVVCMELLHYGSSFIVVSHVVSHLM